MSESFQSYDQKPENYYKGKSFHQSNRPYRGRGRGRGDIKAYNVQRTLKDLDVTDLRQHLDRKHESDQWRSGPPSDPSYCYLRDPLRDDPQPLITKATSSLHRSNSNRGRGRPQQKDVFIQNPMNIRVELSTSTGQRNYSVNEDSTLAIRHIPDYSYANYQEFHGSRNFTRGRGIRARGTGQYVGDQSNQEQYTRSKSTERRTNQEDSQVRSKSVEYRKENERKGPEEEYRGRDRNSANYEISSRNELPSEGRRGRYSAHYVESNRSEFSSEGSRGRGEFRGRTKGRGRDRGNRRGRGYHRQNISYNEAQPSYDDSTTDNWDNEVHQVTFSKEPETEFLYADDNQQEVNTTGDEENERTDYGTPSEKDDIEENIDTKKSVRFSLSEDGNSNKGKKKENMVTKKCERKESEINR